MWVGQLALTAATIFAATAFYVGAAEQPARLKLTDAALLTQWKPSYHRGTLIQAPLTLIGGGLGLWAWRESGCAAWAIGAALILAPMPWTLLVMWPTNKAIEATDPATAGPETRRLIEHWGRLHLFRTLAATAAALVFLWASVAYPT